MAEGTTAWMQEVEQRRSNCREAHHTDNKTTMRFLRQHILQNVTGLFHNFVSDCFVDRQ
jgi:hypothetical protein